MTDADPRITPEDKEARLIGLGTERLARSLVLMAAENPSVSEWVERLIATPTEALQKYQSKLKQMKGFDGFIPWSEASAFANEVSAVLDLLRQGAPDPCRGAALVGEFFALDKALIERCDDSGGSLGEVFQVDATQLFAEYARDCTDKEAMADLTARILEEDDYGVRGVLLQTASQFLPGDQLRRLIARYQAQADTAVDEYRRRDHLRGVESLARQLGDAPLFEKTRIAAWGDPSPAACLDIGRVYLECDDLDNARSWLERVPPDECRESVQRDELLLTIYPRQGCSNLAIPVAWRIFRRHRNPKTLDVLIAFLGESERENVIAEEAAKLLASPQFILDNAQFLLQVGSLDDAEQYVLTHAAAINGDYYWGLQDLAEELSAADRNLAACMIYRALVDSILHRGKPKTYHHGVHYLQKLDLLAPRVSHWGDWEDHTAYKQRLYREHQRKYKFWGIYTGKYGS